RSARAHDLDDLVRAHAAPVEHLRQRGVDAREERGGRDFERAPRGLVVDLDRAPVEAEERELRRGELNLRRVDGGEDLVAELQLDRAAQRSELALGRAEGLEVVERLEDRLLVERRQRAP